MLELKKLSQCAFIPASNDLAIPSNGRETPSSVTARFVMRSSVRAKVGASETGGSVGESVGAAVGGTVGALVGEGVGADVKGTGTRTGGDGVGAGTTTIGLGVGAGGTNTNGVGGANVGSGAKVGGGSVGGAKVGGGSVGGAKVGGGSVGGAKVGGGTAAATNTERICPAAQWPGMVQTNTFSPTSAGETKYPTGDTPLREIALVKSQFLPVFRATLCGMGPSHWKTRVSPTFAYTGGSSGLPKGMTQLMKISLALLKERKLSSISASRAKPSGRTTEAFILIRPTPPVLSTMPLISVAVGMHPRCMSGEDIRPGRRIYRRTAR